MLSQLIEQQQLRRKDLKQLLEEMEAQRQNQAADYWLVQYQRLMESMPENIQHAQQYLPSAPSANLESEVASAPPVEVFMETNCVICFDSSVSLRHFKKYLTPIIFQLCVINFLVPSYIPYLRTLVLLRKMWRTSKSVPNVPGNRRSATSSSFIIFFA